MSDSRPCLQLGITLAAAAAIVLLQQGCQYETSATKQRAGLAGSDHRPQPKPPKDRPSPPAPAVAWKNLFDGKSLSGWKRPQFGGEGNAYVENGAIVMEAGSNITGVTWTGDVLCNNYELSLEGMKLEGSDFFCTTTFPVGDDCCSLVVGGWGGGVVGLSNVDFHDASSNPTMKIMWFKKNRWYRVRIRVTDAAIEAWIDEQQVIGQPRKGHKFGIRSECDLCRPLGICTYDTKGTVRDVKIRSLDAGEKTGRGRKQAVGGGK